MAQTSHDPRITKSSRPLDWAWVRARALEGTLALDREMGVWPINYYRVWRGWGTIDSDWAPDTPESGRLPNPVLFESQAKAGRRGVYYRVWNARDARRAFARGHVVRAAFRVTESWEHPPEGKLEFNQSTSPVLGGHSLEVLPPVFDQPCPSDWTDDEFFVCPNTWGREWGNRGCAAMRYDFFDRENYEAWAVWPADFRFDKPSSGTKLIQSVVPGFDGERRVLSADLIDSDRDELIAWATVVHRRGEFNVEDLYVKPDERGQGHADEIMRVLMAESQSRQTPLRFWIPFADVDKSESRDSLREFFSRYGFGFAPSPFPSAACCAVSGGQPEISSVQLPPKPAYLPNWTQGSRVDWDAIRQRFAVSGEFLDEAKQIFEQHAETLRRLA